LLKLFWPESDAARGRNTLSQALHHLRQALGADIIENQGPNAVIVPGGRLWCDAVVFGTAVEKGELALALDLYRGDFCPTLFVDGAPAFDAWLEEQRHTLRHEAEVLPRHPDSPVGAGSIPARRGERRGARRLTAALAVVALSLIAWRWARAPEPLPPRT